MAVEAWDEFKIRLPVDEGTRLREKAAEEDRTVNAVVRRAIRAYLEAEAVEGAAA